VTFEQSKARLARVQKEARELEKALEECARHESYLLGELRVRAKANGSTPAAFRDPSIPRRLRELSERFSRGMR
jgi:hypothetical protein